MSRAQPCDDIHGFRRFGGECASLQNALKIWEELTHGLNFHPGYIWHTWRCYLSVNNSSVSEVVDHCAVYADAKVWYADGDRSASPMFHTEE